MSREDRKKRDMLLSQYGFLEKVGEDGEVRSAESGPAEPAAPGNINKALSVAAEREKREAQKRAHDEKVKRDADQRAAEKRKKEQEKKRTEKKEKRRGCG
mmetsp:Transcript_46548/g.109519  ORF Transcript_46548/g.109519 Transcript_46548/m.109519 type:complete len:100 (-) Transcript_46548:19-318(-)